MLISIYIKNYALIEETTISFDKGFTIITGETGAGKSILLGALGLVLGNRSDFNALRNSDEKCIIEAAFDLSDDLLSFFESNDIDFEKNTLVRREILPNGKTRAFVNDSPVNLNILSELGNALIDIHSQHQTQELTSDYFQFELLDAFANHSTVLEEYRLKWSSFKSLDKEILEIKNKLSKVRKEQDYDQFLLTELEDAKLQPDEQLDGEQLLMQLTHAELIIEKLQYCTELSNADDIGLTSLFKNFKSSLSKIAEYSEVYKQLSERAESLRIEFFDLVQEIEVEASKIQHNPELIQKTQQRLDLIYQLHQKHHSRTIDELLLLQNDLKTKSFQNEELEIKLQKLERHKNETNDALEILCKKLHENRTSIAPKLIQQLKEGLHPLGMPDADFEIEIQSSNIFNVFGKDQIQILFTANKGGQFASLKKVASGGEMSRIMFTVKSLLARYQQLPTIIFDEIDTGVSGEIADKMAQMMKELSSFTQVISITHLAQIAAKGHQHYKVFKISSDVNTVSEIKKLNQQERIIEIAQMVSGIQITETAIDHAKALLN
jgi:DNA repair protein RecN (Recombination protein N)